MGYTDLVPRSKPVTDQDQTQNDLTPEERLAEYEATLDVLEPHDA